MSYQHQPLGTVIASLLNYDQLCTILGEQKGVNNKKSTYAPCDGRSIKESDLETMTRVSATQPDPEHHIEFAPDLRGKFLRGLNLMYSPGQGNNFDPTQTGDPDGDHRKVGEYQKDVLIAHNHPASGYLNGSVSGSNNTRDVDNGNKKYNSDPNFGAHNVTVTVSNNVNGGQETRPRNVAVYYYIKIN
jgi:hypothetical protein